MKKYLVVLPMIIFSGFVFGQNDSLPTPPLKTKEVNDVSTATICYDFPDHQAYFPKGTEVFVQKIKNLIPLKSIKTRKNENMLNASLGFMVERDGTIRDIRVLGSNKSFNQSIEKALHHINGKWIPARKEGNTIRSKIQIPFRMNLE